MKEVPVHLKKKDLKVLALLVNYNSGVFKKNRKKTFVLIVLKREREKLHPVSNSLTILIFLQRLTSQTSHLNNNNNKLLRINKKIFF